MKYSPHIVIALLAILVSACAQVVAPTGGTRDTQPPQVKEVKPKNESLNFNREQTISITFDEFVKLENINDKLIISPPLEHDIKTKLRGKNLEIKFEDTLKENTTYVMNFNESIVDLTENNPLDFTYVFSTGNEIDSFVVSGRLVNAFDLKVVKDAWVALYNDLKSDSLPMKKTPTYIDKTNEEGLFEITNVKAGKYKLLAIADENKNFLFDKPTEKIAFKNEFIEVSENSINDSLKLFLFEEDKQKLFVEEKKEDGPHFFIKLSRTIDSLSYNFIDTTQSEVLLLSQVSKENDSLHFWMKNIQFDNYRLVVESADFSDTIKFDTDTLTKKNKLKLTNPLPSIQPYYQSIKLEFNRPIKSFDASKVKLLNTDSVTLDFKIEQSKRKAILHIKANLQQDSSYHLIIADSAFTDIYGFANDSIGKSFSIDAEDDYSTLEVEVVNEFDFPQFVQLLDGQEKVIQEHKVDSGKLTFNHLKSGKYNLKLIIDRNGNGKWDTGDYIENLQPEPVWMYEETIDLRPNWDQEIKWIIAN